MALELSGYLLPPANLTSDIEEQLRSIRYLYPDMAKITHRSKWAAGELIVSDLSKQELKDIDRSVYGPLKQIQKIGDDSHNTYRLVFSKPYHPAKLAVKLEQMGIKGAEAMIFTGDGDDVQVQATAPTYYTYIFSKGWEDCPSGCIYKHFWEFSVAPTVETLTVKLEKEYGSQIQ